MVNRAVTARAVYVPSKTGGQGDKVRLPKTMFEAGNYKHVVSLLHGMDKTIPIRVHVGASIKDKKVICDEMYGEECANCPSVPDWKKSAKSFQCAIAYFHEVEGKTFEFNGNTYPEDTEKVVMFRPGKNAGNLDELMEADEQGFLQDVVWKIKKTGEGKNTDYTYSKVHPKESEFSFEVPAEIREKYACMTENDIAQIVLSNFDNVKWDIWEVDPPLAVSNKSSSDEFFAPKQTKKASTGLD